MAQSLIRVLALVSLSVLLYRPALAQRAATPSRGLIVPPDLYDYADSLGCDQVTDFYEGRPGVLNPPFVCADSLAPWWETASALWCRPRGGPPGEYTLLFRFGRRAGALGQCPIKIEGRGHIGGLSIVRHVELTLDHFRYVDEPTKPGPEVPATDVAIRSEYDGTGTILLLSRGALAWFLPPLTGLFVRLPNKRLELAGEAPSI